MAFLRRIWFGLIFTLILADIACDGAFAQSLNLSAKNYGLAPFTIIHDSRIDTLLRYIRPPSEVIPTTPMDIQGFRVQIFFGSERAKATEIKTTFLRDFPDMNAYIMYQQPNFKIRVGDFRTWSEASKFATTITGKYGVSFIVRELVHWKPSKTD